MADEDSLVKLNQARKADKDKEEDKKSGAKKAPPDDITAAEFLLIGGLALIKDAIDPFLTVSIVGIPLQIAINIPVTLILWLWCALRLKRFPTTKLLGATAVEFIAGFLPAWTAFVVSLWLEQTGYLPKWLMKKARAT